MASAKKLKWDQLRQSVELKNRIELLERQFYAVVTGKNRPKQIRKQRVTANER